MRAEHIARNGDVCQLCGAAKGEPGICGQTRQRSLDEDHHHGTGQHRGFICSRANAWLPKGISPAWLRAAADYLERAAAA